MQNLTSDVWKENSSLEEISRILCLRKYHHPNLSNLVAVTWTSCLSTFTFPFLFLFEFSSSLSSKRGTHPCPVHAGLESPLPHEWKRSREWEDSDRDRTQSLSSQRDYRFWLSKQIWLSLPHLSLSLSSRRRPFTISIPPISWRSISSSFPLRHMFLLAKNTKVN